MANKCPSLSVRQGIDFHHFHAGCWHSKSLPRHSKPRATVLRYVTKGKPPSPSATEAPKRGGWQTCLNIANKLALALTCVFSRRGFQFVYFFVPDPNTEHVKTFPGTTKKHYSGSSFFSVRKPFKELSENSRVFYLSKIL